MSLTGNNVFAGASGHETNQPAFTIDQSLRFNDGDGSYLSKAAPGAAGNLDNWTVSGWFKRGQDTGLLSSSWEYDFFSQGDVSSNPISTMAFYGTASDIDKISIGLYGTADTDLVCSWKSAALFRDHSAWYHVVVKWDNSQSAAADILKVYVNGEVISGTFAVSPSQGTDTVVNKNFKQYLGKYVYETQPNWWDGYMAEYHFIDGQSLTAASFGETDSNNQWVPIEYQGTYGTQGWYLNFSDSSSIGADSSGNGNNFTANALAATDVVLDSPSNNFCTLNPIFVSPAGPGRESTLEQGNLKATTPTSGSGYNGPAMGTIGMTSGKWYFEWYIGSSNYPAVGIAKPDYSANYAQSNVGNRVWLDGGSLYGASSSSSGVTYTTGDIVGCAVDMDNGKMWFSKNGTFISSGDPAAGTNAQFTDLLSASDMGSTGQVLPFFSDVNWSTSDTVTLNTGQDSSFAGVKTAQNNSDGNGKGDFYYTPPTGFLALCADNLPDATITTPSEHFNTITYTGNGTSPQARTGLGHKPSFLWIKDRGATNNHVLTDSVRGPNGAGGLGQAGLLYSNATTAEVTGGSQVKSYDTDGFTTHSTTYVNVNTNTYVAWSWKGSDTPSKTYTVTVTNPGSGNRYTLDGRVSGTNAMPITLEEGGTYTFDQSDSSNGGHPLRFSTTSNGTHGGGSEYTTGVTTNGVPGQAGAYTRITVAASAPTLYYYCTAHSGMGAEITTPGSSGGVSNLDGTTASVVNANTTAGFSIIAYTGTGTTDGSDTVGHGLSQAPELYFVKARTEASHNWNAYAEPIGVANYVALDLTGASAAASNGLNHDEAPTSSVITLGSWNAVNESTKNFIIYAFHSVEGYSKVGSYEGNGSADGSFIYLGFKPEFFLIKNVDAVEAWEVWDGTRETHNKLSKKISPNTSDAEYTANTTTYAIDFLSNGVKLRTSYSAVNGSNTFLYYAVASSPFKTANAR